MLLIIIMLLACGLLWLILSLITTYPKGGHYLYKYSQYIEAWCYGFKDQQLTVSFQSNKAAVNHRTVHYWDSNSNRIFNRIGGNKTRDKSVIVLLHGFTADRHIWLRCAKHLNKKHRVIIPDLLGHGDTGYDQKDNHSTVNQAAQVLSLMQQLDIQQFSIAGNSMGGFIAAQCALLAPSQVLRIVLSNAAGVNQPTPSRSIALSKVGQNPFFMDQRDDFMRFYAMTMATPPFVPKIILDAKADDYIARKAELMHIFDDFFDPDDMLDDHLKHFSLPVLVLWGAKDEIVNVSASDIWAHIDNAIKIVWDDLGHLPMVEAPKQTALEMLRFLR